MRFQYVLKVSLWIWLIAAIVLGLLLSSCNPYEGVAASPTPTATTSPTFTQTPMPVPTTPSPRVCTVHTGIPRGMLNLRKGAGVRYAVIRILNEGEALKVLERASWIEVIDRLGNHGFVYF